MLAVSTGTGTTAFYPHTFHVILATNTFTSPNSMNGVQTVLCAVRTQVLSVNLMDVSLLMFTLEPNQVRPKPLKSAACKRCFVCNPFTHVRYATRDTGLPSHTGATERTPHLPVPSSPDRARAS
jgi:hypothetical protein